MTVYAIKPSDAWGMRAGVCVQQNEESGAKIDDGNVTRYCMYTSTCWATPKGVAATSKCEPSPQVHGGRVDSEGDRPVRLPHSKSLTAAEAVEDPSLAPGRNDDDDHRPRRKAMHAGQNRSVGRGRIWLLV